MENQVRNSRNAKPKPKIDLWIKGSKIRTGQFTHWCLRDLLLFAQSIGIFQVENIRSIDPSAANFKWFSVRMVYPLILLLSCTLCLSTGFYKAFHSEVAVYYLISPIFYTHSSLTILLLLKASKRWPEFIQKTANLEVYFMEKYKLDFSLRKRVNTIAIISYVAVIVEHCLTTANFMLTRKCPNSSTGFEYYAKKQFHYIFGWFPYSTLAGIFFLTASWIATFIWNFGDTFIVVMCTIMATRYKQLTAKMTRYAAVTCPKGKFLTMYASQIQRVDVIFWKGIREDYDKLCQVCRKLDELLSDIVLVVYTSNLCFILIQLFISLRDRDGIFETVYFFYSFGFVILRTIFTSIYGGWLYEESRAPLIILNSVPTEIYNEEISRLIWQIHISTPAITGHNFFKITKGLVLSVAAAIITYELVLIQFNQNVIDRIAEGTFNKTICL